MNLNFFGPAEIAANACSISEKKSAISLGKATILGILAGAYIAFGANFATVVGSDAAKFLGFGIGQMLFGLVFSVGLMLVVIGGAELFTGNNMFMFLGAMQGCVKWSDLAKNWVVVYIANFIGSMLLVGLIFIGFYSAGPDGAAMLGLSKGAVGAKALLIAKGKLELSWIALFSRAILCNWLVCMAVWLSLAAKDISGKIFAIMFPIMAFVASGFEHSVANMYFIPMGILLSDIPGVLDAAAKSVLTPDQVLALAAGGAVPPEITAALDAFKASVADTLTWGKFFVTNLIPVTLGNIVGGAIFVGSAYWYAHLKK